MHVFYINLDRRADRNAEFLRRNSCAADCQRVRACEGGSLRTDDLIADGSIIAPLEAYTPGGLGNALSHKGLWERAMAAAGPLTIAEDDAVLNHRFSEKAAKLSAKLPRDWDIILWGWNFDSILHCEAISGLKEGVMHFDPSPLRQKQDQFQALDVDPVPLRLLGAFGTLCYSVSPKGAQLLRSLCFPLRNEQIPIPGLGRALANFSIDVMMNKYYRTLRAFVSFPPLAWSENDKATSDDFPVPAQSVAK
ncbi:MAG: glycosyltransferase family 25 protein [Thermoguttaceae bacterium]